MIRQRNLRVEYLAVKVPQRRSTRWNATLARGGSIEGEIGVATLTFESHLVSVTRASKR